MSTELPELRAELLRRAQRDQHVRQDLDGRSRPEQWASLKAVDADISWLERVVLDHGWPGIGLVGTEGAHAAWLLAQVRHEALRRRVEVKRLHRLSVAAER